jgi:hypothetical protein
MSRQTTKRGTRKDAGNVNVELEFPTDLWKWMKRCMKRHNLTLEELIGMAIDRQRDVVLNN